MTDSTVPPLPAPEAADLLSRAASDIAHDLNNLRAVVQGNLRLVIHGAKASGWSETAEPLADVDLAFQAVVILAQGVLALAREGPARAPGSHPLLPVLRKVEALARWALPPQFGISVGAPVRECTVLADPDVLQAALLRLALCAKDAAPRGGEVLFSVTEVPAEDSAGIPPPVGPERRFARLCVEIPEVSPASEIAGSRPVPDKSALRFEYALALAGRATATGGDVRWGKSAEGRSSVCLLLPLVTPEAGV